MRKTLAIKMLLAFLTITGCKTYKSSDDEIVNIDGKVVFSQDKSPLGQTVITRVSDGKAFLADTLGNFHVAVQTGDSLRFSFVGTVGRTLSVSKGDSFMRVELEPYLSGNDEYVYNEKYFGEFENGDDGSTLVISRAENGYNVSIKLFRLTEIDDGFGDLKDGKLVFTGTDAIGNPISGEIAVGGDIANLVFTRSTWEYLPDGTSYTFVRKHDIGYASPNAILPQVEWL